MKHTPIGFVAGCNFIVRCVAAGLGLWARIDQPYYALQIRYIHAAADAARSAIGGPR